MLRVPSSWHLGSKTRTYPKRGCIIPSLTFTCKTPFPSLSPSLLSPSEYPRFYQLLQTRALSPPPPLSLLHSRCRRQTQLKTFSSGLVNETLRLRQALSMTTSWLYRLWTTFCSRFPRLTPYCFGVRLSVLVGSRTPSAGRYSPTMPFPLHSACRMKPTSNARRIATR